MVVALASHDAAVLISLNFRKGPRDDKEEKYSLSLSTNRKRNDQKTEKYLIHAYDTTNVVLTVLETVHHVW
jgi:hypothetical protein